MEKIVIFGGRGTAIVVADQVYDANKRYGMDVEVLGLALDDHSGGDEVCGYPILCDVRTILRSDRQRSCWINLFLHRSFHFFF